MIRVRPSAGGSTILLDDRGSVAFVDRDWIPESEGPVLALHVDADGILWRGEQQLSSGDQDASGRVAELIVSFAERVTRAVERIDVNRVQVTGQGVTAAAVRRRLGLSAAQSKQRPLAIIEMTGDATELRKATELVADGGVVVLGGQPHRSVELNLYRDVHRRGLQMVGVPDLGFQRESSSSGPELPEPLPVRAGEQLPVGLWYRVSG